VKRRDTSGEPSEAGQGLRAQLSRAVGGSLGAIRSVLSPTPKSVSVSKQRLSDVLWNDRTLLASHETARAKTTKRDEPDALESIPDFEIIEESPDELTPVDQDLTELVAEELRKAREPRKRVDTRPSEVVRARLEDVKARVATKMTSMPKGVAPVASESPEWLRRTDEGQAPGHGHGHDDDEASFADDDMFAELEPPAPEVAAPMPITTRPPPPITAKVARPKASAPAPRVAAVSALPPPPPIGAKPPPLRAAPPPAADDEEDGDEEPICTRSMARLLAGQGHRARALKIYEVLLAADNSDEALRAEADALRRVG